MAGNGQNGDETLGLVQLRIGTSATKISFQIGHAALPKAFLNLIGGLADLDRMHLQLKERLNGVSPELKKFLKDVFGKLVEDLLREDMRRHSKDGTK